jgi:2,3-bisphosphoglycerate-independent phosphoglycerate mutase
MDTFDLMRELSMEAKTKIVMLVVDGLGGLPIEPGGPTELEAAHTPNLDALAGRASCGLSVPVLPGISPGSGPGHLSLFGYDPLRYEIGRGVLEALGIGFELGPDDVAARGNFCTVDGEGRITDRRAGRIPTEVCVELVKLLRVIELPAVQTFVEPVKDYRFVLVLRGDGLSGEVADTDPQQIGAKPLLAVALSEAAEHTATLVNQWIAQAARRLADRHPANMLMLRGFAVDPRLPTMRDIYKLRSAAVATYPMYRGVAKLVGMDVLKTGETLADEIETVRSHWAEYDFFFVHVKKTDSAGEDGDFARKVSIIEEVDRYIPDFLALKPDVFLVTGDHSTPAALKRHSWHSLPVLLWSNYCRPSRVESFGEAACARGNLGFLRHTDLMPLVMANADRLNKYGA